MEYLLAPLVPFAFCLTAWTQGRRIGAKRGVTAIGRSFATVFWLSVLAAGVLVTPPMIATMGYNGVCEMPLGLNWQCTAEQAYRAEFLRYTALTGPVILCLAAVFVSGMVSALLARPTVRTNRMQIIRPEPRRRSAFSDRPLRHDFFRA